jgi:uncharacterized protein (DUF58 family)
MMVPSSRLIFLSLLGGGAGALALLLWPALTPLLAGSAGLLALWILADAVASRRRLADVSVRVPEVVRLVKDRPGEIPLRVAQSGARERALRAGLRLPGTFAAESLDHPLVLPPSPLELLLPWPCRPVQRGQFELHHIHLEEASRWGWWQMRRTLPLPGTLRVYPNLLRERKHVAALFLNRGGVGVRAQRQLGKGRDFEKLREYIPGDSYEDIHWKATAKRGNPVTKMYQVERTQEVYVILDHSRLTGRFTDADRAPERLEKSGDWGPQQAANETILERFVTASMILGMAAQRQGDHFGLVAFSDRVQRWYKARSGKGHFAGCREALYALRPEEVTPDFEELFTFLKLRLRRRALLVFLTALDDPLLAEHFVRHISLLSRQHLVLANMIRLPGIQPLFSNPDVSTGEEVYREFAGHLRWQQLREIQKELQHRGVQLNLLDRERLAAELVSHYMAIKQKQVL